jgi:cytochrome b561
LSADLLLYGTVLHLLAALYHHYFRKDKTLLRMLPNW